MLKMWRVESTWIQRLMIAIIILLPLLYVAPVLIAPQYNILDAPLFCDLAQQVRVQDPNTYLNLEPFKSRAQYGYILYMFPCQFSIDPLMRAWLHSGVLLFVSAWCLYYLLYAATGRRWLAAAGVPLCLCNPSLTENYYTLFKAEPWMLAGMLSTIALLYKRSTDTRPFTWWRAVLFYVAAVVAALLTFSIKETGSVFIVIYLCGTALIAWAHRAVPMAAFRRTWLLLGINVAACAIEIVRVLNLPMYYNASGLASYDTSIDGLYKGICRLGTYFWTTASYAIPAAMIIVLLTLVQRQYNGNDTNLRRRLGWALFLWCFFAGAIAPYLPWQGLESRQYLVAATVMPAFVITCIAASLDVIKYGRVWQRIAAASMGIVASALLVCHVLYVVIVGPLSEGTTRYALDMAYNGMYQTMAAVTPTGAVAYFMMDHAMPEPIKNTRISMRLFHRRDDIECIFPYAGAFLSESGYVAVSDYNVSMNYNRMPLHHNAHALFHTQIAPHLNVQLVTDIVYETRVWYATNTYHGPQYKSVWGIPAFWDLKRGVYRFGWNIYAITSVPNIEVAAQLDGNLLVNSRFARHFAGWSPWGAAADNTNFISIVRAAPESGASYAVRIHNPRAQLAGVKQHVNLVSGEVYRLSAAARSVATNDSTKAFGGRVALFLPPQPEQQLVWMSEYNHWWPKSLVFTNQVTGTAVVYAHLGYGKIATTGEFSAIRLERVGGK